MKFDLSKQNITREIANLLLIKDKDYTKTLCHSCFAQVNVQTVIYNMDARLCNAKRVLEGWYIPQSIRYAMADRLVTDMVTFMHDGVYGEYFGRNLPKDFLNDYHALSQRVYNERVSRIVEHVEHPVPFDVLCELIEQGVQVFSDHLVEYLYEKKDLYDCSLMA